MKTRWIKNNSNVIFNIKTVMVKYRVFGLFIRKIKRDKRKYFIPECIFNVKDKKNKEALFFG